MAYKKCKEYMKYKHQTLHGSVDTNQYSAASANEDWVHSQTHQLCSPSSFCCGMMHTC